MGVPAAALPRVLGVVGAGQMGAGIAQVAATSGLDVILYDPAVAALERAQAGIRASLHRLVRKALIPAATAEAALRRIVQTGDIEVGPGEARRLQQIYCDCVPFPTRVLLHTPLAPCLLMSTGVILALRESERPISLWRRSPRTRI